MIKIIIIILLILCCIGCTNKSLGVKKAIEYGSKGIACSAIGIISCSSFALVDGYLEGQQKEKANKVNEKNAKYIKKMADKQAEKQGVQVKDCLFFNWLCD